MLLFPTLSAVPDPDSVDGVRLLGIQCGVGSYSGGSWMRGYSEVILGG